MTVEWWIGLVGGLITGYFTGRTLEWSRVIAYLAVNEDQRVGWLRTGILCDRHRRRRRNLRDALVEAQEEGE